MFFYLDFYEILMSTYFECLWTCIWNVSNPIF